MPPVTNAACSFFGSGAHSFPQIFTESANSWSIYGFEDKFKWLQGVDEHEWTQRAKSKGIVLRPLSFYEHSDFRTRDWQGAVLGYGNVALNEIDALVEQLSELFE